MSNKKNCSLGNIYALDDEGKLRWVARPLHNNSNRIVIAKKSYSYDSFLNGEITLTEYLLHQNCHKLNNA